MEQADMKLDGNAIGGLLREIFTMEMTTAETTCAGCGGMMRCAWRSISSPGSAASVKAS